MGDRVLIALLDTPLPPPIPEPGFDFTTRQGFTVHLGEAASSGEYVTGDRWVIVPDPQNGIQLLGYDVPGPIGANDPQAGPGPIGSGLYNASTNPTNYRQHGMMINPPSWINSGQASTPEGSMHLVYGYDGHSLSALIYSLYPGSSTTTAPLTTEPIYSPNPYTQTVMLKPGDTLIISKSVKPPPVTPTPSTNSTTIVKSVITFVDKVPPAGSFRPPAFRPNAFSDPWVASTERITPSGGHWAQRTGDSENDPLAFNTGQINFNNLQNITPPDLTPSKADLLRHFLGPWLDVGHQYWHRFTHPSRSGPHAGGGGGALTVDQLTDGYTRESANVIGQAMLWLNTNQPQADKLEVLIPLLQIAIDTWGARLAGGLFCANGTQQLGRKPLILFAGHVLNNFPMRDVGNINTFFRDVKDGNHWEVASNSAAPYGSGKIKVFHEDGQTRYWDDMTAMPGSVNGYGYPPLKPVGLAGAKPGDLWEVTSVDSIDAAGSGYSVNDILTNPDTNREYASNYAVARYKVTAVNGSGGVTELAMYRPGIYHADGSGLTILPFEQVIPGESPPHTPSTGTGLSIRCTYTLQPYFTLGKGIIEGDGTVGDKVVWEQFGAGASRYQGSFMQPADWLPKLDTGLGTLQNMGYRLDTPKWVPLFLALHIMGLKAKWLHDNDAPVVLSADQVDSPAFDYVKFWMTVDQAPFNQRIKAAYPSWPIADSSWASNAVGTTAAANAWANALWASNGW